MAVKIVGTSDGSDTLYVPELGEHYHSVYGAIQESEYIFIRTGLNYLKSDSVRIFEAGFGTGLNALLTYASSITENRRIFYHAIDSYPLPQEVTDSLNYTDIIGYWSRNVFRHMHSCVWDKIERISDDFILYKQLGDLTKDKINGSFNLIYYDAFGPDKQPEMWSDDIFARISGITESNGVLVTYSAKGSVKRGLKRNGFDVSLLPGPPGKRQIIRAIKI